jgi:hypothetical protein
LTESLTKGARTSYRFQSLSGYHGAKLRRYQDLLDNQLTFELDEFVKKAQAGEFDFEGIQVMNMLNTKYIIAGSAENAVFENPAANGSAWVPTELVPVANNQAEMEQLGKIDTKVFATVTTGESPDLKAGQGQIKLDSYLPNELKYTATMQEAGLGVFSEIHYPVGWTATIDGQETEILRVDYLLRGLAIPEGQHEVIFKFAPKSYTATKTPMIIFQYLILAGLIAGIILTIKSTSDGD